MIENNIKNNGNIFFKDFVIYSVIFYFIFDQQTRIPQNFAQYTYFSIIDIRKYIGLTTFEWCFWIFLLIPVLLSRIGQNDFSKDIEYKRRTILLIALVTISLFSTFLLSDNIISSLRTIFYYTRPLLIFWIVTLYDYSIEDVKKYFRLYVILFFIMVIIGYYQAIFLGYRVDDLSAMMDNAHTFAFMMYVGILYFFIRYLRTEKKACIFYMVLLLVLALMASADKLTFLFPILLIYIYAKFKSLNWKSMMKFAFLIIILLVVGISVFSILDTEFKEAGLYRFVSLLDIENVPILLGQIRLFDGYYYLPMHYLNYPYAFIIGVGPAMYGSADIISEYFEIAGTTSLGQLTNSELKNFAFGGDLLFSNYSLFGTMGTSFASSDIIVLLLEFGLLFSFIYFIYFKIIWKSTELFKNDIISGDIRDMALCLRSYLIFIFLLGLITFQDGIIKNGQVYPYFIGLAILCKLVIPDTKTSKTPHSTFLAKSN